MSFPCNDSIPDRTFQIIFQWYSYNRNDAIQKSGQNFKCLYFFSWADSSWTLQQPRCCLLQDNTIFFNLLVFFKTIQFIVISPLTWRIDQTEETVSSTTQESIKKTSQLLEYGIFEDCHWSGDSMKRGCMISELEIAPGFEPVAFLADVLTYQSHSLQRSQVNFIFPYSAVRKFRGPPRQQHGLQVHRQCFNIAGCPRNCNTQHTPTLYIFYFLIFECCLLHNELVLSSIILFSVLLRPARESSKVHKKFYESIRNK